MARNLTGLDSNLVSDVGGSVRVTIPATPFQVQANAGVSIPCRRVYMITPNGSSNIRVQIGAACTDSTGLPVPELDGSNIIVGGYLELNVSDISLLYFIGEAENDVVDILYLQ